MDIKNLNTFIQVAELNNFTKAAEKLEMCIRDRNRENEVKKDERGSAMIIVLCVMAVTVVLALALLHTACLLYTSSGWNG